MHDDPPMAFFGVSNSGIYYGMPVAIFRCSRELDFVAEAIDQMDVSASGSRVSLAMFNPMVNSIAKFALSQGNRRSSPDVIVVISGSKYQIPELLEKEVLLSPVSPIHAFYILVGSSFPDVADQRYEATANTLKLTATGFDVLPKLNLPLCQSVRDFVGRGDLAHPMAFGTLCWIVTTLLFIVFLLISCCLFYAIYVYREDNKRLKYVIAEKERDLRKQNEYFTARIHRQMEEQMRLAERHKEDIKKANEELHHVKEKEKLRNEAVKAAEAASKPREQPQPIIIYGQPMMENNEKRSQSRDSRGHRRRPNSRWRTAFDPRFDRHMTPNFDEFKKWWRDPEGRLPLNFKEWRRGRPHSARTIDEIKQPVAGSRPGTSQGEPAEPDPEIVARDAGRREKEDKKRRWEEWREKQIQHGSWKPGDYDRLRKEIDEDGSEHPSTDSDYSIPVGHLSRDHPARHLPPVDIIFLIDTSSSIGIQNFEKMKSCIEAIVQDVDVAPGRSRVAAVQFAGEPQVVFGFDKYFTIQSIQRALNRIIYTGGPTHLSKALSFCAGVLWKEQNMADGKHRKHKLAKTPRHDRLQVLCVASDGSSEDNVAKSTSMLHERLQIKVCALVTRAFHRQKLEEITRFDGAIFVVGQKEAVNIWLWRQQRLWWETYSKYLAKERKEPLSSKRSPKKTARPE
ncbi:unnamed protein product, partial [Mesorhabditis spiculigera]